ncbi:uncharacterized protein LOC117610741 isoform X1 [Osmia lignaria lignaria]|uniref:uncharacterized protein LOC117610741 isoform X1 n=1 Tax=Osmia lignaria lignaria TaxID=1437193 RepID=UPI0014783AC0|nr:uncharacterized protein LOC117610741 [Osmia lignaria]
MQRGKTNDLKVRTGWTHKWVSPNRIRRKKDLHICEVVRGPFYSPKLLTTQPIISCQGQVGNINENCNNLRHGIPDTWKEYLIRKGFCNSLQTCFQQKNLITSCVRSFATERIWNELGLPLMQGIPDPWKCKFLVHKRSVKCTRRRGCNNDNSTQITCIYDGDDEAEIEHSVKSQFNEDHIVNKKDLLQEENKESRKKIPLQTSKSISKEVKNDARKRDDRLNKKLKLASQDRKLRNVHNKEIKDTEKINSNARVNNKKSTILKKMTGTEKVGYEKPSCASSDAKVEIPPNCTLQNDGCSNIKERSQQPLQGVNITNLVVCQNCENINCSKNPQQLNSTVKKASEHKIINHEKDNERTKCKSCHNFEKAKGCFKKENPIETKNEISEPELKLICGQCNNPYLKIAPVRKKCSDTCKKEERNKIKNSVTWKQYRNIVRGSKNCCTQTGSKMHASRGDLGQTACLTKSRNNVLKRDSCDGPEDVIEINEEEIIPMEKLYERELPEDTPRRRIKRRKSRRKSNGMISNEKSKVKQFQQVRFDPTLRDAISDSGEYADVSDNFIGSNTSITSQDKLSVTSITFIRRLKRTIPIRKLYRELKLENHHRPRWEISKSNQIDFEHDLEDEMMNSNQSNTECNALYCSDLDDNDKEILRVNCLE